MTAPDQSLIPPHPTPGPKAHVQHESLGDQMMSLFCSELGNGSNLLQSKSLPGVCKPRVCQSARLIFPTLPFLTSSQCTRLNSFKHIPTPGPLSWLSPLHHVSFRCPCVMSPHWSFAQRYLLKEVIRATLQLFPQPQPSHPVSLMLT